MLTHKQRQRLSPALRQSTLIASNPIWRAMNRAPMAQRLQTSRALEAESAFEEIIHGRGTLAHLEDMAIAANVALILAEQGVGPECEPKIIDAQEAIARATARARTGRGVGFDGPGITAIKDMLATHHQQIQQAGHEAVTNALTTALERAANGLVMRAAA